MWIIWGKYQGEAEEIDSAETRTEAEILLTAYQLAFGSNWSSLWITRVKEPTDTTIEQAYKELEIVIKELGNPDINYISISHMKACYLRRGVTYNLWTINVEGLEFQKTLFSHALAELIGHVKEGGEL